MHVYIAGIGGAGMRPLAEMAKDMGYEVSGSDLVETADLKKWQESAAAIINIRQTAQQVAQTHHQKPIDWYIYSSALTYTQPLNPELAWIKQQNIKHSKRDEFINDCLQKLNLKLLAVSGSHGKTTTTALLIWALKKLGMKVSYALGGKIQGLPASKLEAGSQWFIYEADEFDRNFLAFKPDLALITGIDHDHHEVYPIKESYLNAFIDFLKQSKQIIMNSQAYQQFNFDRELKAKCQTISQSPNQKINLLGFVNRQNATLALQALKTLLPHIEESQMIKALNCFPGSYRRFEALRTNLYTDYAHNIAKIEGCLQIASELNKPLVVVYEPHSNLRQYRIKQSYRHLFDQVSQLYWLPTYLSREDSSLKLLAPHDFISILAQPEIAQATKMNESLRQNINQHLENDQVVVGMSAGTLDQWLRTCFT